MSATAEPPVRSVELRLDRAAGVELLGEVHGSGYRKGAALVRRGDGQMVQLGPLQYALLEAVDGRRTPEELAAELCDTLGRDCDEEHVLALAQKLAAQGLLAGHEHNAPPRRNPLLALRWKALITNPRVTRWIAAPFTFLFWPWLVAPVVLAFLAVCWFVLFDKGIASATSEALNSPGLLILVLVLGIGSAGFHELGHASACRYGGATPGGMGMGIYMVWPAFYTDVTDSYRLPKRDRLRVDLGGIYFNAVISVATLGLWLAWRHDALLLLVGLQLLMMVKNLSPVIRSDGYHILADATGVPDLYAHIGPTLKRLIPGHRDDPSALKGSARALVTVWVLVVVPVLLSLMVGAVLLLPRLTTTAWDSGRAIAGGMGHESTTSVVADIVRLFALVLPVIGSALVTQKLLRLLVRKARTWSAGRPARRLLVVAAAAAALCGTAYAWWPSGQYQRIRPTDHGTLLDLGHVVASPTSEIRPDRPAGSVTLASGTHLAVAMVPVGGATKTHPAIYFVPAKGDDPPVALVDDGATVTTTPSTVTTTPSESTPDSSASPTAAAIAFPFKLPDKPKSGDSQALATGTQAGGVTYDIVYSLVTVRNGAPVTNENSAYALASCNACTTVAVSFQVVLIVGTSKTIAPINIAEALNDNCPSCMTTAIADQIVVTLNSEPTDELVAKIEAALKQLGAIKALGANGTPAAIAAAVTQVQQQIDDALQSSGQVANPPSTGTSSTSTSTSITTTTTQTTSRSATTTTTPATTTTDPVTTTASTTPTTSTQATTTTETTTATTTDQTTTTSG